MLSARPSPRLISLIVCLCLTLGSAGRAADPTPTHSDVSYGPHPHQLLDIYLPEGDGPFPVLIWYGRLWEPGLAAPPVKRMFQSGVAAVAVRTRVMKDGVAANMEPPISACLLDARRALQYVRLHAAEWKPTPTGSPWAAVHKDRCRPSTSAVRGRKPIRNRPILWSACQRKSAASAPIAASRASTRAECKNGFPAWNGAPRRSAALSRSR